MVFILESCEEEGTFNATVVTVTVYNILLFINMIISSISKSVLHIMFYLCMRSHISNSKLMYR